MEGLGWQGPQAHLRRPGRGRDRTVVPCTTVYHCTVYHCTVVRCTTAPLCRVPLHRALFRCACTPPPLQAREEG